MPDGSGWIKLYKGGLHITENKTLRTFDMKAGEIVLFSASGDFEAPKRMILDKSEPVG